MADREIQQLFGGYCPYTGKLCTETDCKTCEIEQQERLWLDDLLQETQQEV